MQTRYVETVAKTHRPNCTYQRHQMNQQSQSTAGSSKDSQKDGDSDSQLFSDGKNMNDNPDDVGDKSGNLFDQYKNVNVFDTRDTLQDSYTPTGDIEFREEQQNRLMAKLGRAIDGDKPGNAFLQGPNGTGKTLLSQRLTTDLKNHPDVSDLEVVHVNCASCKSESDVAVQAANMILPAGDEIADTGYSTHQTVKRLMDAIEHEIDESAVILLLDDVTRVESLNDILYQISRSGQPGTLLNNTDVSVMITANQLRLFRNMRDDVRSSLEGQRIIKFPGYTNQELSTILSERANKAFIEGSIDQAQVKRASAMATQQGGDARYGLDILREAGELAEVEGVSKVTDEHISQAKDEIDRTRISTKMIEYDDSTQLLLACIPLLNLKNDEMVQTGVNVRKLHKKLADKFEVSAYSNNTYYRKFQEFVEHGLIESSRHGGSSRKEYNLLYPSERYIESLSDDLQQQILHPSYGYTDKDELSDNLNI